MMKISLHHVKHPEQVSAEVWHKALAPSGKLLILDHLPFSKVYGKHEDHTLNVTIPVKLPNGDKIVIPLLYAEWNPINQGHAMVPDDVIEQLTPLGYDFVDVRAPI